MDGAAFPPGPGAKARKGASLHKRDADQTRARILSAALAEFSGKGFSGARVDAIAERSECNKQLIYRYFGGKEELWIATLEAAYERARLAERKLELERLDPQTAIRRLIEFTFDSFVGDRTFINLLNSENLHGARHLKQSKRVREMHSPLIAVIESIIERGEKSGVFTHGIDAAQLWISIVALSFFYFSNSHTLSAVLGRDLLGNHELVHRRGHIADLLLHGICKAKA